MAQRTQIVFADDIDGSEAEVTVRFAVGGTQYEIDLNAAHAEEFRQAVRLYVDAARKAGRGPSLRSGRSSAPRWRAGIVRGSRVGPGSGPQGQRPRPGA
jgi:hypothetical protein